MAIGEKVLMVAVGMRQTCCDDYAFRLDINMYWIFFVFQMLFCCLASKRAGLRLLRKQNKNIIIIAHRLPTIRKADKIIVLDKGKVVEEGSHNEMIFANGYYAKLWKQQFGDDDLAHLLTPSLEFVNYAVI